MSQSLRALFGSDVERWCAIWELPYPAHRFGRWRTGFRLLLHQCGMRAILLYRISHALHRRRVPFLPGSVSRLNLMQYGLDIPSSVAIGPGLYIPHPVGTVVMGHEPIGANLSLISGITIGMRTGRRFPVIGDNVFIGAGARVLGDIQIGDGASIGANAVVLCDVPAGAVAVGVPATIKIRKAI